MISEQDFLAVSNGSNPKKLSELLNNISFCSTTNWSYMGKKKLEEALIEENNGNHIYSFAVHNDELDVELLTDAIVNSGDAINMYFFARNIEGANIEKLTRGILKTQNVEWITYFAIDINNDLVYELYGGYDNMKEFILHNLKLFKRKAMPKIMLERLGEKMESSNQSDWDLVLNKIKCLKI